MAISPQSGRQYTPLSEINITPFVDVVLVLLIIFMVTAPMLENEIPLELPQIKAEAISSSKEKTIILSITEKKLFYLNQKKIPSSSFYKELKRLLKTGQYKTLLLRADKKLPYGYVAKILNQIKRTGLSQIGLITTPTTNP